MTGSLPEPSRPLLPKPHITQFIQPEQADAEGLEVRRFVAVQRHASDDLQALSGEFVAVLDLRIGGVADRLLLAGSRPSLTDGSYPSAAVVQSASDIQCSRL